ncbi:beta-ketoacyl reductase, partial [Streptomyces sp. ZYX-F-203]
DLASALDVDPDAAAAVAPALSAWRGRQKAQSTVDSWRYQDSWERLRGVPVAGVTGTWLALVPAGVDGADQADKAWTESVLAPLGADLVRIDVAPDTDRATLAARLAGVQPAGVLSLLGTADRPYPGFDATSSGLALSVVLVQALGDAGITAPLWAVTRGAVTTGADDTVTSPAQTALWGLGRVAALDLPHRWGGLVDLPEEIDDRIAEGLVAALSNGGGEDQLAVRASGVHGRRLVPAPRGQRGEEWQPRGTVLITGGTGALGGHVARWVVDAGAEHVVLTSRRGAAAPGAQELRAELEAHGTRVTLAACDASDRAALAALLEQIPAEHPLTAVVHAAGVVEGNAPTDALGIDQLDRLLRAKTTSAWNLHELTADNPEIEAFILFSSGAASWGSGAQPAYAAANAYLDGLAHHRRGLGLAATSVAWGAWADSGMAAENAEGAEQLRRRGLHTMAPELAIRALRQAVADGRTQLTVTNTDWEKFAPSFTAQRPSPLLDGIPDVRRLAEAEAQQPSDSGFKERLAALPESERGRVLLDLVRAEAAATLGYDETDAFSANRAFRDVGFDSVMAVDLRNRLKAATGVALPATLVFDHPTPAALGQFIRTELLGETGERRADDPEAHIRETLASIPISRLRKAGLLDLVLQLAQDSGEITSTDSVVLDPEADSIDDLDGEALLRLAIENSGN